MILWNSDIIYTIDKKGHKRQWEISVQKNNTSVKIVRQYGLVMGTQTILGKRIYSGKNIGRSNETTIEAQAINEAKSLYAKQKEVNVILPMLASKWNPEKTVSPKVIVQPKLDGVRMMVCMIDGHIRIHSRTGKPVTSMNHIIPEALTILNNGCCLDGECYSDTIPFQEISGKFRKDEPCTELQFHVFDMCDIERNTDGFRKRFQESIFKNLKYIKPVLSWYVDERQILTYHEKFVREGYEGIIIRHPDALYEVGFRSKNLLKHKDFDTNEFKIIECVEGTGRDEGTAIFVCECDRGTFNARPMGDMETRREYWSKRTEYIEQMLTVKHQGVSEGGIPRFPVGVAVRNYE